MTELLTTREDAAVLKAGIDECVKVLERQGLSRGQIGVSMTGIGFALSQVHLGHKRTIEVLDVLRAQLTSEQQRHEQKLSQ